MTIACLRMGTFVRIDLWLRNRVQNRCFSARSSRRPRWRGQTLELMNRFNCLFSCLTLIARHRSSCRIKMWVRAYPLTTKLCFHTTHRATQTHSAAGSYGPSLTCDKTTLTTTSLHIPRALSERDLRAIPTWTECPKTRGREREGRDS